MIAGQAGGVGRATGRASAIGRHPSSSGPAREAAGAPPGPGPHSRPTRSVDSIRRISSASVRASASSRTTSSTSSEMTEASYQL